jgi:hypothetical protein
MIATVNITSLGIFFGDILGLEEGLTHFLEVSSSTVSIMDSCGTVARLSFHTTLLNNISFLDFVCCESFVFVTVASFWLSWSNISELFIAAFSDSI